MKICTAAGVLVWVAFAPALAASKAPTAPAIVSEQVRAFPGGRTVQVIVPQAAIETSIDVGRVARPPSGGLLDTLIVSSMDNKRDIMSRNLTEKAQSAVSPLRTALSGYDVDTLALLTTKAALAKIQWFDARDISLTKDGSPQSRASFVANSATNQLAFVQYRYGLSPDFTNIRVIADIALARADRSKNGKAAPAPTLLYKQTITSIVQLNERSYEPQQNVASWSAEDGKRAKAALVAAFGQMEMIIPYALGLSVADMKSITATNREKAYAVGFYGPLANVGTANAGSTLIWSDGFVNGQTLP